MSLSNDAAGKAIAAETPNIIKPVTSIDIKPQLIIPFTKPVLRPLNFKISLDKIKLIHKIRPIEINMLTIDQQADVQAAVVHALASDEGRSKTKQAINEFTKKTKNLSQYFDEIENSLGLIDKEGLEQPLVPKWRQLKAEYRRLLWGSRDVASKIATSCGQFEEIIIPIVADVEAADPASPQTQKAIKDATAAVQWFMKASEENSREAKAQSDGFQALKANISGFATIFESFADERYESNKLRIKDLKDKIVQLNKNLDSINKAINIIAAGCGLVILGASLLSLIPGVAPWAMGIGAAAVAAGGAAAKILGDQADGIRKQISQSTIELRNLESENVRIVKTKAELAVLRNTTMQDVLVGLESFEVLWAAVNTDCTQILSWLQDFDNPPPIILVTYWKAQRTLYSSLREALLDYAAGIVN